VRKAVGGMVNVALFSGGKDSMYSIMKAKELGVDVDTLLFVKLSLQQPSPHELNIHAVRILAEDLGLPLEVVELKGSHKDEALAEKLKELKAEALIAGDASLEDHLEWHERVCRRAGVDLLEPLFKRPAKPLLKEMVESGVRFTVIAVRSTPRADLLGVEVSKKNVGWFIEVCEEEGWDPLGEQGEYHTLINASPMLRSSYKYVVVEVVDRGAYGCTALLNVLRSNPPAPREWRGWQP